MNGHTSTSVTTQLSGLCNVILILNDSRLPIYVCSVIASYTFCLLLLGTYYVSAVFKPPIILLEKIPLESPMYVSTNEMEFTPFIFLQPFLW